ncbi:MAG: hypothetical protein KGJ23_12185 [Euryarchaeota archaeon]|nr:hypothetical protein [Euryarchaeota archaeon]MDE1837355.1 hypothetical protein [Euryarchaeota archaeon]MDE1881375.1 hypothetical protein [Euryarchaeota archaeon]MDE2045633.1 hypothetical protein [Thermoplasmata archaeon]
MPFRPRSVVAHGALTGEYARWEADARAGRQPAPAIWKGLQTAILRLKLDGQWGEVIPPRHIPAHFRSRYGVENLYCVDLASFHRLFYTILDRDVILLDIVDHATYDEWFPGSRR